MDNKPSMLKATLIGGSAAGVLSAIPIVNWLNCVCCAYLIGGGVLAAFVYSKDVAAVGGRFTVGNGALVGLVTALWYSVVGSIVGFVVQKAMGISIAESMEQMRGQLESQGGMSPDAMEGFDRVATFLGEAGAPTMLIIGFGISLVLGAIFCTVGGLIGGAVFKKEPAVPAAPADPMP